MFTQSYLNFLIILPNWHQPDILKKTCQVSRQKDGNWSRHVLEPILRLGKDIVGCLRNNGPTNDLRKMADWGGMRSLREV